MFNEQGIPCPVCRHPIPFDTQGLLSGKRFACGNCSAIVSIANESVEETRQAVVAFEQLKQTMGQTEG